MQSLCPVVCPSCFESFEVAAPSPDESPAEVDYDCEICCRPMLIHFFPDDAGGVAAEASGLGD